MYAVTSIGNVHFGIILIKKFRSSKMDLLLSNSSRTTKIKPLISIQLIILEGIRKISA